MKRLLPALSIVLLPSLVMAEVAIQGSPAEAKAFLSKDETRVTLRGAASTLVEASDVTVSIRISADGPNSTTALGLLEQKTKDLTGKLEVSEIARGQMKVPKFATITPRYGSAERVSGYSASLSVTVELHEQKQYLDLLTATEKIPGVAVADLQYSHSRLANLKKAVLANACKRVMARKEVYEQNLGMVLRPVSFTEDTGSDHADPAHKDLYGAASDVSAFGQIPVKASLSVVFEVVPGPPGKSTAIPASKELEDKKGTEVEE